MDKQLLIICGPTATGKTALAIKLAKKFDGELISADSRQVYKGMDIGTGKDIPEIQSKRTQSRKTGFSFPVLKKPQYREWCVRFEKYIVSPCDIDGIPLWMIDVVEPDEEFSVSHYHQLATAVIQDIRKRGKLPIIVGGTGLYIQSLLSPIETSHIPPNKNLRKQLERLSLTELQGQLQKESPSVWESMNQSDRQNPRRLVRKIEIIEFNHSIPGIKEVPIPGIVTNKTGVFLLSLTAPFHDLYKRIDERVDKRLEQGIIKEIEGLLKKGYSWDLPSMNTFGYKEWKEWFLKGCAQSRQAGFSFPVLKKPQYREWCAHHIQSIIQRWKWDEHGYARRQMTWFRKMQGIVWQDITENEWQEKVETIVKEWYTHER